MGVSPGPLSFAEVTLSSRSVAPRISQRRIELDVVSHAPPRRGDDRALTRSRILVNSVMASRELLLSHAGIGQASRWFVHADLDAGDLVEVLPQWTIDPTALHIVYPSGTLKTRRVIALVDYLIQAFARLPGFAPVPRRK